MVPLASKLVPIQQATQSHLSNLTDGNTGILSYSYLDNIPEYHSSKFREHSSSATTVMNDETDKYANVKRIDARKPSHQNMFRF